MKKRRGASGCLGYILQCDRDYFICVKAGLANKCVVICMRYGFARPAGA